MKLSIATFLIVILVGRSFGQQIDNEKSLMVARDFMRKIYDMVPFDSLIRVTTLDKDAPKARVKYSSGYFEVVMLRLFVQEFPFSELSYLPYLYLPDHQRKLVYERFIEGIPDGIDLSTVYAVMNKTNVVTYLDIRGAKVFGIRATMHHTDSYYLHEFSMDYIDNDSTLDKWESPPHLLRLDQFTDTNSGLVIAQDFIKFIHDSLTDKNSIKNYIKFQGQLCCLDTLDLYTISFTIESLKEKVFKIPYREIKVIPYLKLSRKQKKGIVVNDEKVDKIFAVRRKKEIITYLCLEGNKVKYYLALKNLTGQYVFVPYGLASQTLKI